MEEGNVEDGDKEMTKFSVVSAFMMFESEWFERLLLYLADPKIESLQAHSNLSLRRGSQDPVCGH